MSLDKLHQLFHFLPLLLPPRHLDYPFGPPCQQGGYLEFHRTLRFIQMSPTWLSPLFLPEYLQ